MLSPLALFLLSCSSLRVNDLLGATANPEVMKYGFLINPLSCVVAAVLLWRGNRTLENLGQD